MKLSELKHNHSLTDLLKILIFSILMLTPLLSVASRCMYVICNKNAYENYSGTNNLVEEYTPITELNTNIMNETLYFNVKQLSLNSLNASSSYIYFDNYTIINSGYELTQSIKGISFYIDSSLEINAWLLYEDNTTRSINSSGSFAMTFRYFSDSLSANQRTALVNSQIIKYITYNNNNTLDNVFEYSISQLENSEYYNWTQNTAVYTGVKAMTTNLQINGNVIPILITYWFLLTVIYVIIDIVLKLFTTLTHLIGSKKA